MRATTKLRDLRSVPQLAVPADQVVPTVPVRVQPPLRQARPRPPLRLLWLFDTLPMRAGRRLIAGVLSRLIGFSAYGAIALTLGLTSAWYMIEAGSGLTLERDGPWKRWMLAGAAGADPYTRAHFARAGWLPLTADAASYFTASRDSMGEPLYSDCAYTVSGQLPVARRWTLVAYDMNGTLLDPGPGPVAIASETALPAPNGAVAVTISQSPSPGNWLNVTGATRIQLMLTVFGARQTVAVKSAAGKAPPLFAITRTGCR